MKKTFLLVKITLFILCSLFLCSCTGYNSKMREHLKNADNYNSYSAKLTDIYYYDSDSKEKIRDYSDPNFFEHDITFELEFYNYKVVSQFLGSLPNTDIPLSEYRFHFKITKENNNILLQNGFYDEVSLDTPITVTTSNFIYGDGNFFLIASVEYNDTIYLPFESGLDNIIEMMNDNKSLF